MSMFQSLLSWERGLKSMLNLYSVAFNDVAPLVGAWIEIEEPEYERLCNMVAPLVGTWIEILQG